MKTYLFLLTGLIAAAFVLPRNTTILHGKITDESNGEALIGASVKVYKGTEIVRGAITDFDGNYRLALDPGAYDVEVSYTGFATGRTNGVKVLDGQMNVLDMVLSSTVLQECVIKEYKVPLVKRDETSSGSTLTSDQIRRNPGASRSKPRKDVAKKSSEGEAAKIKGSRSTDANYYIDGIRVSGRPVREADKSVAPASPVVAAKPPVAQPDPAAGKPANGGIRRDSNPADFSAENYARIFENPFQPANAIPVSTFSIDVDGASYANARRFLNNGQLPPADAVRIEEFVNYFDYHHAQPTDGKPFALTTELGACPWSPTHSLLMVGIQGRSTDAGQLPPSNFVFLIDVSGSMGSPDKLPLVQQSLELLTDKLRPIDRVALVVYAGAAGLVLPSTPGTDKVVIKDAIQRLSAGGSTAGAAGIQLAYQTARANLIPNGNNRVVLCTDGDFNVGVSSDEELVKIIEKERESGVFLTVLGFGTGNYQDGKMQQLADKGNGNHAYIDQLDEAKKVLVREFGGTMFAIAKDVKIQIEFNPTRVAGYRLIGYENRLLNKEDFDDDTKDAGELGSGHTVTALYEIIPAGGELPVVQTDGTLQFRQTVAPGPAAEDRLLTLKLRYKEPKVGAASKLIETVVKDQVNTRPSENFDLAAAVSSFGMLLRNSAYKGTATYDSALFLAQSAAKNDTDGYRKELCELIEKAKVCAGRMTAGK